MGSELEGAQRSINRATKRIDEAYGRAARAAGLSDSAFDILYACLLYTSDAADD